MKQSRGAIFILAGRLQEFGGIETHLTRFALEMRHRGVPTNFFVTSHSYSAVSKAVLLEHGVRVHEFDTRGRVRHLLGMARCARRIATEWSKDDVLYSNAGDSGFAYLIGRLLKPSRWVHHHHGDVTPSLCSAFSSPYKKLLQTVPWLIACTGAHRDLLEATFSRRAGTMFLPILKAEGWDGPSQRLNWQSGQPLVVGFFGRLRKVKGVETLLRMSAWFARQGMVCRLHGDDCEGLLRHELPPAISWTGPYDSARDLNRLLAQVHLVVLPTVFAEGLPIVMSEAISRGVPVVAYASGGLRDMKDFHPGVIVIEPHQNHLEAALLEMAQRIRREDLGSGLAAKYRELLGNRQTLQWWESLLAEK